MRTTFFASTLALAMIAGCEHDRSSRTDDRDYRTSPSTTNASTTTQRTDSISRSANSNFNEMDQTFVREAGGGGMFEVQSAKLAMDRVTDPKVMDIAHMLIDDHTKANQELQTLAARAGIEFPQMLPPQYQRMVDDLRAYRDNEFTQQFRDLQMQAHQEAVDLFDRESREGQNPDLQAFAKRTLPTLRKHLDHIRAFQPPNSPIPATQQRED